MRALCSLFLLGTCVALAWSQKNPNWLQDRNTIVHLFEWKFSNIAEECERFLGPQGYAGVQISPVSEYVSRRSIGNPWWERYSPVSYKIASRSGDELAFVDMVRRCNNVGVRIYVDVVLKHMGGTLAGDLGIGGSPSDPPNKYYPAVPFGPVDFRPTCWIIDYNNPEQVRNCSVFGLNKLDQGKDWVRAKQLEFLDKLVDYGVAGFRIDGAHYMWPSDLQYIYNHVKDLNTNHGFPPGSRPFIYQEVFDYFGSGAVHSSEYTGIGRVTEFRYGSELSACFRGNNALKWLRNFGPEWFFVASSDALAFIDNHDNQRGSAGGILTYKLAKQYKMANAFMQAWPYGVTRVMSSYDFTHSDAGPPADFNGNIKDVIVNSDLTCSNGWVCEHRWRQIYNMVQFRRSTEGTPVTNWWDNNNNQIAFCRGDTAFIAFNGENYDLKKILKTCLPQGSYCDLISGLKSHGSCTGKVVTVSNDGSAYFEILTSEDDGVLAITLESRL